MVKAGTDLCLYDPVCFRFEGLDLVMTFHTEPQCGSLTGTKRDQGGVQIPIFSLEVFGLETKIQRQRLGVMNKYW